MPALTRVPRWGRWAECRVRLARDPQAALDALMQGRSSVVIAHRLSTVKNASRICVMEDGQVVEEGKHDELMAQGGHYAHLVKNQELAG